ncbi:GLPGLI family protein [Muricauda sp. 334s03]|uniref:GLPGLI family protein n=1 Tax=Flagellimonas yonaguniensis TaxID=3031325 RepID=A0ABT5XWZ9_9FLAO|nr:GLPGLI family protein [[Muricauda] yonaguniensis]MDF0715704.1 GLPGLI family protein [[Muricauda] yonaguniensis]
MMKILLFSVFLMLTISYGYSQSFIGTATYQSKTSIQGDFGPPDMPEARKQEIMERMKKAMEKTYELTFDRSTSIYVEEEKLEAPSINQSGGGRRFGMFSATGGTYYKDIQEQTYTNEVETFGKKFLIKDSLRQLNWELTSETKKIGNYTCYKAIAVKVIDTATMDNLRNMLRPPRRDDADKEEGQKQKDSVNGNSLLARIEAPKEQTITAWFTPDIPVGQGPGSYWGLPGLILEVNDGRTAILCSKIVLNPDEEIEIVQPKRGKEVSQAEYNQILAEKMKEMSERFRNNGRRSGGPGGRP